MKFTKQGIINKIQRDLFRNNSLSTKKQLLWNMLNGFTIIIIMVWRTNIIVPK